MPSPCSAETGTGSPSPSDQASRMPDWPALPSALLAISTTGTSCSRSQRAISSSSVDRLELEPEQAGMPEPPVAGDARLVVDQRQLLADQPVEQRRFADVRPADDHDLGEGAFRHVRAGGGWRGRWQAVLRDGPSTTGFALRSVPPLDERIIQKPAHPEERLRSREAA